MKTRAKRRGARGVLTAGFSGSVRWRDGLAVASSLSVQWLAVRAFLGGSPVVVTVTMGLRHSRDAPRPVARARAAAKQRGGVELKLAGGNGENGREVASGILFIRARFLACATRSPRRFYLQFEACLFFSWDLRKIS
jgi:hypothetical protein